MLVLGEDQNDSDALGELLQGLSPSLEGRTLPRRNPVALRKTSVERLPSAQAKLRGVIAAERTRHAISLVVVHEDCDAVEPAHREAASAIEAALRDLDVSILAAVPAWEIEAWWFLWPDAVAAHRASWRAPRDYEGKDVGRVVDAKEALKAAVVPAGLNRREKTRFRGYEESDSPGIAMKVRSSGQVRSPKGRSASFSLFEEELTAICARLGR